MHRERERAVHQRLELWVLHPQITPSPGVNSKQTSPCQCPTRSWVAHDIPVLIGFFGILGSGSFTKSDSFMLLEICKSCCPEK